MRRLVVITDGSSSPRLERAAVGASIVDPDSGRELAVRQALVPYTDSTTAEILAALAGVTAARDLGGEHLRIFVDDLSLVGRVRGHVAVHHSRLVEPVCDLRRALDGLPQFEMCYVGREFTWRADDLARAALLGRTSHLCEGPLMVGARVLAAREYAQARKDARRRA